MFLVKKNTDFYDLFAQSANYFHKGALVINEVMSDYRGAEEKMKAITDLEQAVSILHECRKLGIHFALDDFGTGYSSLTYLRRLPVDTLKIDQSFVRDMLEDSEDLSIVRSVIQLASVFGKQVIAEGVESLAHCYKLEQLGCSNVQGYGIAKPMNATVLPEWCKTWPQTASLHKN